MQNENQNMDYVEDAIVSYDELVEKETKKSRWKKIWKGIAIGLIVLVVSSIIFSILGGGDSKKKGASKNYIEYCTEYYLKKYVKFPETFRLEAISFKCTDYEDKGYQFWVTSGSFTCENVFGVRVRNKYVVYMQYVYEEDVAYKTMVIIDEKIMS